jgi:phosphatidylinositol dimannoside acyltransferase
VSGILSLEGSLLRRFARWGSSGPDAFVRTAAPLVGVVAFALARRKRRIIVRNLRRVRGKRGPLFEAFDAARTFANYAACVADGLGAESSARAELEATVHGQAHLQQALTDGRGAVVVTAHTGGWEAAGAMLARDLGLDVAIVERPESDEGARVIQDGARRRHGLKVIHVGEDPFTALPLVHHLRQGGVVALQIDRVPVGMRPRFVEMFGAQAPMPEGPLRLAALTGAPMVPVFSARRSYRRYTILVRPPIRIERDASDAEFDRAAQQLADELAAFARSHPTQWFHFDGEESA